MIRGAWLRVGGVGVGVATVAVAVGIAVAPGVSRSDDGSTRLAGGPPQLTAHDPLRTLQP